MHVFVGDVNAGDAGRPRTNTGTQRAERSSCTAEALVISAPTGSENVIALPASNASCNRATRNALTVSPDKRAEPASAPFSLMISRSEQCSTRSKRIAASAASLKMSLGESAEAIVLPASSTVSNLSDSERGRPVRSVPIYRGWRIRWAGPVLATNCRLRLIWSSASGQPSSRPKRPRASSAFGHIHNGPCCRSATARLSSNNFRMPRVLPLNALIVAEFSQRVRLIHFVNAGR